MTVWDKNIQVLKRYHSAVYENLLRTQDTETVYVGKTGYEQDYFLALEGADGAVRPFGSTYAPAHYTDCYIRQFSALQEHSILIIMGLGDGKIPEKLLEIYANLDACVVYEPSAALLRKALEHFDMRALLADRRFQLYMSGMDSMWVESELACRIGYQSIDRVRLLSLWRYADWYAEDYERLKQMLERILEYKRADLSTLKRFSCSRTENEIRALQWIPQSRCIWDVRGRIPATLPYIVAAAGPSLEKNVDSLKAAQGKAFIACVDTAASFLLNAGVMPDLICTMDPEKGTAYFEAATMRQIPLAVTTDSDYRILQCLHPDYLYYAASTNDFYEDLFRQAGSALPNLDLGGTVATFAFQLGIELGFRRIILVGQDLAYAGQKMHAGMTGEAAKSYRHIEVEGYYGGTVWTQADFKHYIDWYERRIAQLPDIAVINATEGGARIRGTVQMPLSEAVARYCDQAVDVVGMLKRIPLIWNTEAKRTDYRQQLAEKWRRFIDLQADVREMLSRLTDGIKKIEDHTYTQTGLQNLNQALKALTERIGEEPGIMLVISRMIDLELESLDAAGLRGGRQEELLYLYTHQRAYLAGMYDSLAEVLNVWQMVVEKLAEEIG